MYGRAGHLTAKTGGFWPGQNNGIFGPKEEDVPLHGWLSRIGALDDDVGIDVKGGAGGLGSYTEGGYPWQAYGDAPHSFSVPKRQVLVSK